MFALTLLDTNANGYHFIDSLIQKRCVDGCWASSADKTPATEPDILSQTQVIGENQLFTVSSDI